MFERNDVESVYSVYHRVLPAGQAPKTANTVRASKPGRKPIAVDVHAYPCQNTGLQWGEEDAGVSEKRGCEDEGGTRGCYCFHPGLYV